MRDRISNVATFEKVRENNSTGEKNYGKKYRKIKYGKIVRKKSTGEKSTGKKYRKKKCGKKVRGKSQVTSGDVTSGCSPLLLLKYDFVRPHILL
jgi:hypothetical protein